MSDEAGWREARSGDLPTIARIAEAVHPGHPERPSVFAERLALYPWGLLVLVNGEPTGYAISHPWVLDRPPRLDTLLGGLPPRPDTYYVHDIALLPEAQGKGAGRRIMEMLVDHADEQGFATVSLVSVIGEAYWGALGFRDASDRLAAGKLASYGVGARYMIRRVGGR